jgi:hypothetical protein
MAKPSVNFDVERLAPLLAHARRGEVSALRAAPPSYERVLELAVAGDCTKHDHCLARVQVDVGTICAMARAGVL